MNEQQQEIPEDWQKLTKEAAELRQVIDQDKISLKNKESRLSEIQGQILRALEVTEMDSIKAHGFTFYPETKSSVKTPKTTEAKKALFDFLEQKGIFHEFASVNSQSLNALYKTLANEALENGDLDFQMPGIEPPTEYTRLKMRKG